MNTVELFSGTGSFSKVAKAKGHDIFRVELDPIHEAELHADILNLPNRMLNCDILWASPPCTAFSVASIGKHWDKETKKPKTIEADLGIMLVSKTILMIKETKPKKWYIENPRGMLRVIIDKFFKFHGITDYVRHTVTYCQYGDTRMKPTDIWTNDKDWKPKPPCKNGDSCHVAAPRGSKTGTQGIKGAKDRGVIPPALFEEILQSK